ncbi:MAG: hypothetical protein AAFO80_01760 [Pseudomonadota bacterium]
MTDPAALRTGALNLLVGCGKAMTGERVLIVHEPAREEYYGTVIVEGVVEAAGALGLRVQRVETAFEPEATEVRPDLHAQMAAADLTVFLARLGDQLRFKSMPDGTRAVICYALNAWSLASPFGMAPYAAFLALKSCIDDASLAARHFRITCPAGTDVEGTVSPSPTSLEDVSISRFPMSVVRPIPAAGFSGRVALCGFLTGTGSMYYEPFSCFFEGPVAALVREGRLTGFEGSDADVARANAHYDFVAGRYGVDRDFVHSWHAGLHPGCSHPGPASDNMMKWSGSAFGNPRLLHFHTCGAYAPGEISWNVLDATVELDGVAVWDKGRLHPDRVRGGAEVLAAYPDVAELFAAPLREVGV